MTKRALIFGISGRDGAYLSRLLLDKGYEVFGTSRDAELASFAGLTLLGVRERVTVMSAAPKEFRSVLQTVERVAPREIYNLGGQSSVGLSFEQPIATHESITTSTLNILEAVRELDPSIRIYSAASGESFGDTEGANEDTPFRPCSPYAVTKAAAFWQVANYRDAYGLFACSGILFNHESPLRPQRFVTRKVVAAAARIAAGSEERLLLGDLSICRDWGWAPEYVDAMWRMLQPNVPDDYVIATGAACSLEVFVAAAYAYFELDWRDHVDVDERLFRPAEIARGFGDAGKARDVLGWQAATRMPEVVHRMAEAKASGAALGVAR